MKNTPPPTKKNILNETAFYVEEPIIRLKRAWKVDAKEGYDSKNFAEKPIPNEYLVIRTIEGKGVLQQANNAPINLTADTVIIFSPAHNWRYYCKNSNWAFISYTFETEDIAHVMLDNLRHIKITETENRIHEECYANMSGSYYQTLYSQCLFKSLLAFWHIKDESSLVRELNMEHILSYATKQLSSKVTVSQIAEMLNMSEQRFRRMFKKYMGVSPKQYMNEKKLITAKEMLETTDIAVYEIAENCGFYDNSHFNRCFLERFGCSPKDIRNKKR